ncbi:MAG: hypothetical protein ACUVTL_05975 [Thermoproteota archaeon]
MDLLNSSGWKADTPRAPNISPVQVNETRVTTTLGTAFKVSLGAVLGIFVGVVTVGAIASLTYWAIYNFVIKGSISSQFLSYVPLENPLVDLILGQLTSAALFKFLSPKLGPNSSQGGRNA